MKALLNDEGKKIWGEIFPDGNIPVVSPQRHHAMLEGKRELVYLVAWNDLTPDQRSLILNHLAKKFKGSTQSVETQILKDGLPLRASLVACVPIPLRYF